MLVLRGVVSTYAEQEEGIMPILVSELLIQLSKLAPDDKLCGNMLGNIVILRDGEYLGYIECASNLERILRLNVGSISNAANPEETC